MVKQLSLFNENFICMNKRLDSIDERVSGIDSKIAIIDEKFESHDEQFEEFRNFFTNIGKKVPFLESKGGNFQSTPEGTTYSQKTSSSQTLATTTSAVFQDCQVRDFSVQSFDNNACDEVIELSDFSKASAKRGKPKSTQIIFEKSLFLF